MNDCIECDDGRDIPHFSVGKIVDYVDYFFVDDGLRDGQYAIGSSVDGPSESILGLAVGNVS